MKKYIFIGTILAILGVLFTCRPNINAAENGQVYDTANLLTSSQIEELNQSAQKLERQTGWDVFVVTTNDTKGESTEKYNDDFLKQHLSGNDGVSYIIDMGNREIYLSTTGKAIHTLTDKRIDSIVDKGYKYVKKQDYSKAFDAMMGRTYDYCHKSIKWYEALVAVLLALAAGGITFGVVVGKYRLKWGTYKYDFHANSQCSISRTEDHFVNEIVTHHHIERNPPGDGDSGSSVHTGDSGRDFGGGGRNF
jgi:uncharacterized protein